MPPLTARQFEIYTFLKLFFAENDQLPPMQYIADHFNIVSHNTVLGHLRAIERRGYIEKNIVGKYRFTRI